MTGSRELVHAVATPTGRCPWRLPTLALVGLLSTGCTSTVGLPEFRAYQATFDQAQAVSASILDELAVAEREAALRLIGAGMEPLISIEAVEATLSTGGGQPTPVADDPRTDRERIRADGFDSKFYNRDAVYVSDLDDPPGTAGLRRALASVADFNNVLLAYGEGRALDELKAQAGALVSESQSALTAASLALGSSLAVPGLRPALGILSEGADVALQAASRDAFREAVVRLQPDVDRILVGVRDTAPTVFSLLTRSLANAAKDRRDEGRLADADLVVARIEAYRRLIASWVILLERTRAALAATVAAIEAPADQTAALADVSRNVADLRARSARINTLLVELRRNGTPR